jgi:hypothetical protein
MLGVRSWRIVVSLAPDLPLREPCRVHLATGSKLIKDVTNINCLWADGPNNDAVLANNGTVPRERCAPREDVLIGWAGAAQGWPGRPNEMSSCRRTLIITAGLVMALSGAAFAEGESPAPPEQTNVSASSPPVVAAKPRTAVRTATVSAPAVVVVAKPQPTCTLLTCLTLVGVGF